MVFDETTLREEIARIWGEHGAHAIVYDMLLQKLSRQKAALVTAREEIIEWRKNAADELSMHGGLNTYWEDHPSPDYIDVALNPPQSWV